MASTVVGLFHSMADAQLAVDDLSRAGFKAEDIGLIAGDAQGEYTKALGSTNAREAHIDARKETGRDAGIGALLGGAAGALIGFAILTVPGVGVVLAAGAIVGAITGATIGAEAGSLVGALGRSGIPEDKAQRYAEGVRRGDVLVSVHTSDDRSDDAAAIMARHNLVNIDAHELVRQSGQVSQAGALPHHGNDQLAQHYPATPVVGDMSAGNPPSRADQGGTSAGTRGSPQGALTREGQAGQSQSPADQAEHNVRAEAHREDERSVMQQDDPPIAPAPHTQPVEHNQGAGWPDIRDEVHGGTAGRKVDDAIFRNHFREHYDDSGLSFEDYQPAYRYGYELGNNDLNRGRTWDQIEMSARRDWERAHPDMAWDDYGDAIYTGWSSVDNTVY